MAADTADLRAAGDRIETLFDELQQTTDRRTLARAEELLRTVSMLYSAALGRMMELAHDEAPALVDRFAADNLVASVLLAVGIHPEALADRVEQALVGVRPLLATHGGDVELLDVDGETGVVRLRLMGSCDGCPSSAATLQGAVERAILERAPEVTSIEVDQPAERSHPVAVTLGVKPRYQECPSEMVGA
jgi:Fe-S cluster biogenesis protein NfuA